MKIMMNKINALMNALPQEIDCGLIVSSLNRRYFTGMKSSEGILAVTKQEAYFFVDFRYYEKAKSICGNCTVVLLTNEKQQLETFFKEHEIKTVGVETSLTLGQYHRFQNQWPQFAFLDTPEFHQVIENLRLIKTDDEIENIKKAQRIADLAFTHILNCIQKGRTEREIALELDYYMLKEGAEEISFDTIAVAGTNSSLPHGTPTDYMLKDGDFLTLDFGAVVNGYHSDMTRTVAIGHISDEMRKMYDTVLKAQKMSINVIRPGVVCSEVDKIARDYIDESGYQGMFGHSLGHGVGIDIHEAPAFSRNCQTAVKEGMVITVEPGIYQQGKFGVRIEDMVIITKDSCKNITNSTKELLIL